MGIRQTLNENPSIAIGITALVSVAAIVFVVLNFRTKPPAVQVPDKLYFSDDEGKTWFIDDAKKVPPFDHNGKQAVGVILFKCNGKPFVQRLVKFDDEARAKIEELIAHGASPVITQTNFFQHGMMIKTPGMTDWMQWKESLKVQADNDYNMNFTKLLVPHCPDGSSDNPTPVTPAEDVKPE